MRLSLKGLLKSDLILLSYKLSQIENESESKLTLSFKISPVCFTDDTHAFGNSNDSSISPLYIWT